MNVHQLYELIVGEGGCSPDYFLNHMGVDEAQSYVKGLNRRHRQSWEQTRTLCTLVYKVLSGEDLDWEFPWDNENVIEDEEVSEEQLEALRNKARLMEQIMNKQNDTKGNE